MDTMYKTQVGEIEQDMTEAEIAEYQLVIDDIAARTLAEADAQTAKDVAQSKLAVLGLTSDDLKALGLGTN
jgi:hypothetical protein